MEKQIIFDVTSGLQINILETEDLILDKTPRGLIWGFVKYTQHYTHSYNDDELFDDFELDEDK